MAFQLRHLGSFNEGEALEELLRFKVDSEGARRMAGKMVPRLVKVTGVPCGTANILKQEMLSIGGDAAVARGTVACSIPQTDVLLIGTLKDLSILCERLPGQPFGLKSFAVELRALLDRLATPPQSLCGRSVRLMLDQPRIMGVLNVTPDSFSDGGSFSTLDAAVRQARKMAEEGADLIDVGGESTRPGAPMVPLQQELDRVLPVIERLSAEIDIPLSIDTTKSAVAQAATAAGAEFINDVSGLTFDATMADVAAKSGAGLFLMHTRGRPDQMQRDTEYADLIGEVLEGLQASIALAHTAGVSSDRLSVDPGIGFGKDVPGNLLILRRLEEFHALGFPVLLGTSRKSFIGKVLRIEDPQARLNGTLATVAHGVVQGAHLFRVHDVRAAREVALMTHAVVCAEKESST